MKFSIAPYWTLLRRYLVPQRNTVLLMAVLLLASIGLQLAGPLVVRSFLDAVQNGAEQGRLARTALAFLGIAILQQGLRVLASFWSERVGWTATNEMRADLLGHIIRMELSFHQAHPPGELVERIDGDVGALGAFFSNFSIELGGNLLLLAGILTAIVLVDARLGLGFLAFAGLILALLGWIERRGAPHWQADSQQRAGLYGFLGEALFATEDIRASRAAPYILRRYFEHLQSWLPVKIGASFWGQSFLVAVFVAFALGDAAAYGAGGRLYQSGSITLGTVYMIISYVAMLSAPIETIRTQLQNLARADASIARVKELWEARPSLVDGTEEIPPGPLAVDFHSIGFGYEGPNGQNAEPGPNGAGRGKAAVLEDVTFHLEPGRVLGILGRTGSGKTTLARLLFRFYDPQEGEICLGGIRLKNARIKALRTRVGLVPQENQLFEGSLRDNLTFYDSSIADTRLLEVFDALSLTPWLERFPQGLDTSITSSRFSAGEAQLLAFARVFLKDPGLLILDEATSRLDPATEALLEQAMHQILERRTGLIIAHRLASVERTDDILILESGRIIEYGPRVELAADPASRFSALQRTGLGEVLA